MEKTCKNFNKSQAGSMLVLSLVATGLFLVILLGGISLALLQQKLSDQRVAQAQALHIAESGVNYYRWVLYHDHEEYCNKETCKTPATGNPDYGPYGPYTYTNYDGSISGQYELYLTPPPTNGSTIVDVTAVGWASSHPNIKRRISVRCGIPAWSTFSWQSNSFINFGSGAEVWGPIHSNNGIRFDGVAHNLVSSALHKYDDSSHSDAMTEFGVHTHRFAGASAYDVNELCNEAIPPCNPLPLAYSSVFTAGRALAQPVVSYNLLDSYVTDTIAKAQANGLILGASGDDGYHIVLRTDDKVDIYIVNAITGRCGSGAGRRETYGISSETPLYLATSTPPNGIIFAKDNVWVDGRIDGNRITILAFDEPYGGSVSNIFINSDVLYTNYDGSDAIGLIAQKDVQIGLYCDTNLRIDAAMIAKTGKIFRNDYSTAGCILNCTKNSLTTYGSLVSFLQPYFFVGCGFTTRNYVYDSNLTYAPPPHYPTTGEYTFISWDEE